MSRNQVVAIAIAILLGVVYLVGRTIWSASDADTATTDKEQAQGQAAAAQGQARSLADQVAEACAKGGDTAKELGSACSRATSIQRTVPVPVPGPAGPQGGQGPAGTSGVPGPAGPQGNPGVPGPAGVPGAEGPKGSNGEPGTTGAAGQNGQDGATGPAGPQGETGPPGATGERGPAGADGQPPLSWPYAEVLGGEDTCSRTSPFDPSNPTYACS